MAKPFDYSKWDKIELSDDEDDVHPNIDKDSWFRWKHQARVERCAPAPASGLINNDLGMP
jgi:cell division cycle protein 37